MPCTMISPCATNAPSQSSVREVLVIGGLDEECLGGDAGAVGQKLGRDPPPGELVALGV